MKEFQLDIISLTKPVFNGFATSLSVPGQEGELTILANHIPLITPLKPGEIKIHQGDKESLFVIGGGFLTIEPHKVTVLADSADMIDELNEEAIEAARAKAEKALQDKQFADDRSFADATAALERSVAQLKIIRKRRHK